MNSSGIPLYRNNSCRKTSENNSKKQLIVNLECPVKWRHEESNISNDQNHSRQSSVERLQQNQSAERLISSQSSEVFSISGLNASKWIPKDTQMHADELKCNQSYLEKESETYKSFLKMIQERNQAQNDEIRIEQ